MGEDGSVLIDVNLNVKQADRQLRQLETSIQKLYEQKILNEQALDRAKEKVKQLEDEYEGLVRRLQKEKANPGAYIAEDTAAEEAQVAAHYRKIEQARNAAERLEESIARTKDKIALQQSQFESLAMTVHEARTANEDIEKTVEDIEETVEDTNKELDVQQQKWGAVEQTVQQTASSGNEVASAAEKVSKSGSGTSAAMSKADSALGSFASRLGGLVKGVFVFSVITSALRALRSWLSKVIAKNKEASAALAKLRGALLTLVQPLVNVIIPAFTALVRILTSVVAAVAGLVSALFGTTAAQSAAAAEALEKETDAMNGLGGSAKSAAKQMAAFDEINQLSDTSGGGGGGSGAGADFSIFNTADALKLKLDGLLDDFKKGFKKAFGDRTFEPLKRNLSSIAESLRTMFTNPELSTAISNFRTRVSTALGGLFGSAASIGLSVAELITGGIAQFLEGKQGSLTEHFVNLFDMTATRFELIEQFGGLLAGIAATISGENGQGIVAAVLGIGSEIVLGFTELFMNLGNDLLQLLIQPFVDNKEELSEAIDGVLGPVRKILESFEQFVTETMAKLNQAYEDHIKPLFDSIRETLSVVVGNILEGWNTYMKPVLDEAARLFDEVVKEHFGPLMDKVIHWIELAAEYFTLLWNNILSPLFIWLSENVMPIMGAMLNTLIQWIMLVLGTAADVVGGLISLLSGFIEFFIGVFTGDWDRALGGLKEGFRGFANGIISLAEGMVNVVITAVNGLLSAAVAVANALGSLLGFSIEAPHIEKINLGRIPELATGAVIPPNREFLAVLGDQTSGRNIEAPEALLRQMAQEAASANTDLLRAILQTLQQGQIMEVDGRQFGRVVHSANVAESRRLGTNLVGVTG